MSAGYVRELNEYLIPFHPIYVEGPNGDADTFIAVIDTGFIGDLVLPRWIIIELSLNYFDSIDARFGNNDVELVDRFGATVYWGGEWRQITVWETGDRPLIGMGLLREHTLCLDAIEMGGIDIKPIPSDTP